MQRRYQKVAGSSDAVAGEDPPGPVGAVGGGRETDEQETGLRIAESRNRLTPVDVVAKGAAPGSRNLRAVRAKSIAALAGNDSLAYDTEWDRSWFVVLRSSTYLERRTSNDSCYQTRHAVLRTIGASALHENAF